MTQRTRNPEDLPPTLSITGDLSATEDVAIRGQFDGQISVPGHHLSIEATASVKARIVARSVTIGGALEGNILAAERVWLMATARVRGHVTTPAITLADGAQFTGTVDPERSESAMHVARYRAKQA
jgi:cytoskeletal protein CcmA (bactofilin family)